VLAQRLEVQREPWIQEELERLRLVFFQQLAEALPRARGDAEPAAAPRPSSELSAAIQRRIDALPSDRGKAWPTSTLKLDLNALPLHSAAALYVWGLQPDGTVVCLDLDATAHASEVETRPLVRFAVIAHGAAQCPELRELIPAPPAGTRLCDRCSGSGESENTGERCDGCDGFGWCGAHA
jgi:hypothetical protein